MSPRPTHPGNRHPAALLGVFVIPFQAIPFGWHHHPLHFPGSREPPAAVQNEGVPTHPGDHDDGCAICATVHHQTAATVDVAVAPLPAPVAPAPEPRDAGLAAEPSAPAFRARAPPSIDARID